MSEQPESRFQFGIGTLFCLLTVFAVFCVGIREQNFVLWSILPVVFLLGACVVVRCGGGPEIAWGMIGVGWLLALIDVTDSLVDSFGFLSGPPSAQRMQSYLWDAYRFGVALPMLLSVPAVILTVKESGSIRSGRWTIACVAIALADCTLATVLLVIFVETSWPW